MGIIDTLDEAKRDASSVYHEFLLTYHKKGKKIVYAFTEGDEDLSFYSGFIQQKVDATWIYEVKPVVNRENVIKLHSYINWEKYPENQIIFFIDRDLSELLGQTNPNEKNFYISDDYSIENSIVTRETCKRILREVFSLSTIQDADEEKILDMFDDQLEKFLQELMPTMAWIIYWKRSGKKTSKKDLDKIEMKKMFFFKEGLINRIPRPKNKTPVEYIHCQCDVLFNQQFDISSIISELKTDNKYKRFTRGKYVLWFLIAFTSNVHKEIKKISTNNFKKPKTHVNLSPSNGVTIIGPRVRIPPTLNSFLNSTYGTYIQEIETNEA